MKRACWIGCWLAVAAVAGSAHGATFFVDAGAGNDANAGTSAAQPFLTIQKAIDEAVVRTGPDMIQIAEGQYPENLTIQDPDAVTLSGASGVEIVAAASSDAIHIKLGDVTISNLTVTGGKNGIYAAGAEDAPLHLTVRNVASVANAGRGLRAVDVRDVTISDCRFLDNGNDDGIKVVTKTLDRTSANLSIRDTVVSGCGDDGIDLELLNDVRLTNVLVENTLGDDGLSIDDSASVSLVDCVFANSSADGLDLDDTQSIRVVNVISTGNGESGLEIAISGALKLSGITSENNGEPDILP